MQYVPSAERKEWHMKIQTIQNKKGTNVLPAKSGELMNDETDINKLMGRSRKFPS